MMTVRHVSASLSLVLSVYQCLAVPTIIIIVGASKTSKTITWAARVQAHGVVSERCYLYHQEYINRFMYSWYHYQSCIFLHD